MRPLDLVGHTIGSLFVQGRAGLDKHRHALWVCTCSCGRQTTCTSSLLTGSLAPTCPTCRDEVKRQRRPAKSEAAAGPATAGAHRARDWGNGSDSVGCDGDLAPAAVDSGQGQDQPAAEVLSVVLEPTMLGRHLAAHVAVHGEIRLKELAREVHASPSLIRLALHSRVFKEHLASASPELTPCLDAFLATDPSPRQAAVNHSVAYLRFAVAFGLPLPEDVNGELSLPESPTSARPGSSEKIAVLTERYAARTRLFHPSDEPMDGETRS
jgi:hypothetical protein